MKNDTIFTESRIKMLLRLNSNYRTVFLHKLSKELNITTGTVFKNILFLEKKGLVYSQKRDRRKYLYLSLKGKEVVWNLLRIKELMEEE